MFVGDRPSASWHLLFPLGGAEMLGDTRNEFDDSWCRACVAADEEYARLTAQHGASRKSIPVTEQHSYFRADAPNHETMRVGSMRGLAYVVDGVHTPGVYGIIEWNADGAHLIESRKRDELSPTTVMRMTMTDGEEIPGPFILEVGLVTSGSVQTIGNAFDDWFPPDTFTPGQMPGVDMRAFAWHDVECIVRAAAHPIQRETMAQESKAPATAPETPAAPEAPASADSVQRSAEDAMKEMIGEMIESALSEFEARMDEKYAEREKRMEDKPDPPAAEDETQRSIERAGRDAAAAHVRGLVTSGQIATSRANEAINRLVSGQTVDDMLIDGSLFTVRSQGVSTGDAAPPAAPEAPKVVKFSDIEREVSKRFRGLPATTPKFRAALDEAMKAKRDAGFTIQEA